MLCEFYLNLKMKRFFFNKVPFFFFSTKDDIKNQIITNILSHNFTGENLAQRWRFAT